MAKIIVWRQFGRVVKEIAIAVLAGAAGLGLTLAAILWAFGWE